MSGSFADGVVVTSARTAVDTAQMLVDVGVLGAVVEAIDSARVHLAAAAAEARAHTALVPHFAMATADAIGAVQASAWQAGEDLGRHGEALATAALYYAAAEGEAATYFRLRGQLLPGAGADGQWNASIAGLRNDTDQARVVQRVAWMAFLIARLVASAASPILRAAVGALPDLSAVMPQIAALVAHVLTVGGWRTGDGTELDRLQLDLAALSRDMARDSIEVDAGGFRGVSAEAWWGSGLGDTALVAGAVATWLAGAAAALGVTSRSLRLHAVAGPWVDGGRGSGVLTRTPDGRALGPVVRVPGVRPATTARWSGNGAGWDRFTGVLSRLGTTPSEAVGALPAAQLSARSRLAVGATARQAETPRSGSELLDALDRVGTHSDRGEIRILRHETPVGDGTSTRSWSVLIRGTQNWAVGVRNPQDMLANLQGVAGEVNDQHVAVREAMEMAGIRKGEPVEVVGHSQGGIVAGMLAGDPAVRERFDVRSVLTCGAPTGGAAIPAGTHALHLENGEDVVPALDGSPNRDTDDQVTARFRGSLLGDSADRPHDLSTYRVAMAELEQLMAANDAKWDEIARWAEHRSGALGLTPQTRSSSLVVEVTREG